MRRELVSWSIQIILGGLSGRDFAKGFLGGISRSTIDQITSSSLIARLQNRAPGIWWRCDGDVDLHIFGPYWGVSDGRPTATHLVRPCQCSSTSTMIWRFACPNIDQIYSIESLQSWIHRNSSIEPGQQILMTARGKPVKLQTLLTEVYRTNAHEISLLIGPAEGDIPIR